MIDIESIKARLASVGQTPWVKEVYTDTDLGESEPITYLWEGPRIVVQSVDDPIVAFCIHARQDMQDLIAELVRVKAALEYYADRNVWHEDRIDSDDCSEVTVYGSHSSLDFTETVGGKRARESLWTNI